MVSEPSAIHTYLNSAGGGGRLSSDNGGGDGETDSGCGGGG